MSKAEELDNEIRVSIGYKAMMQLELLSSNFYIFDMNFKQWNTFISKLKQPEVTLKLWDQKNRKEFNLTINEATRLLLNFLSSATSLVAATRNSVPKWYKDSEFALEYEIKKNKIAEDEETKFIEGLKNYSQHDRLPFVTGQLNINMKENKLNPRYILDRDTLLKGGDWKKKGRDFLLQNEEELDIEVIVSSYYRKILEFHQWIFNRIKEINSHELQELLVKQKELSILLKDIFES